MRHCSIHRQIRSISSAFTLIELLVVISIISLLTAILLPTLSSARDAAWAVKCASNMKQIGVAANIYMVEHDDVYLPQGFGAPFFWPWTRILAESGAGAPGIARQGNVAYTPLDYGDEAYLYCDQTFKTFPNIGITYAMPYSPFTRTVGGLDFQWPQNDYYTRASMIERPSAVVALFEVRAGSTSELVAGSSWNRLNQWADEVHNGASNFLFADGHVDRERSGWMIGHDEFGIPDYAERNFYNRVTAD